LRRQFYVPASRNARISEIVTPVLAVRYGGR
jgi:hypothetical protein